MPFIDDTLLWCPDNDGRIVGGLDITTCLGEDNAESDNANSANQPAGSNSELGSEEPLCNNDSSDELFRTLSESNFEIESLLSDIATAEVKSEKVLQTQQPLLESVAGVVPDDDDFVEKCATTLAAEILGKDNVIAPNTNTNAVIPPIIANALLTPTTPPPTITSTTLPPFANATDCSVNGYLGKQIAEVSEQLVSNVSTSTNASTLVPSNPAVMPNFPTNNTTTPPSNGLPNNLTTRYSSAANPILVEKLMSKCLNINRKTPTYADIKDSIKSALFKCRIQ